MFDIGKVEYSTPIVVFVDQNIDLEHMLESVSDATYWADNVTKEEQELVVQMITKLKKERDKVYGD